MGEKSFVFGIIFTDPVGFFGITVILCQKTHVFGLYWSRLGQNIKKNTYFNSV
jgi:hypothetical protein